MRWRLSCMAMSSAEEPQMPPSTLVSSLIGFFASHLVVLTLVVFLGVGYRLSGGWEFPAGLPGTAAVSQEPPGMPEEAPVNAQWAKSDESTQGLPPVDASGKADVAAGVSPPRPPPRLIGGSLPIYGAPAPQQAQASVPPSPPQASTDFRPPSLMPAPVSAYEPTRDDLVQQARQAFWNGDFEAAEAAYMMLLLRYPGDADAFGELGNLYQAMGKPEQALDAYYEAAVRLKAQGNLEKLRKIVTLLDDRGDSRGASLMP